MHPARVRAVVAVTSLALLAACGASDPSSSDGVAVVASTNVYGDIAATIGGDAVTVTSVISDPSADPHSFEASARTQLAVSRADLVIENGGGYDDFMTSLLDSAGGDATVIDAVDVSGKTAAAGEELNEHVWYDLPTVTAVADRIVAALSDIDPGSADTYRANGERFARQLQQLQAQEESARATTQGVGVAVTEPVPGYLLDALGAVDRTPAAFSEAIEEGDDVAPAVLHETLDLFTRGEVEALVVNEQTSGPETDQVVQAARDAGVAVAGVRETLPAGQDYVSWMGATITEVATALSGRR